MTDDIIAARRAECLGALAAWAEETELALRRRGAAFTPREREAVDAARARLAVRIERQSDDFWHADMTPKARLASLGGALFEGLLPKGGGV